VGSGRLISTFTGDKFLGPVAQQYTFTLVHHKKSIKLNNLNAIPAK
jgi:hypothetical protein